MFENEQLIYFSESVKKPNYYKINKLKKLSETFEIT